VTQLSAVDGVVTGGQSSSTELGVPPNPDRALATARLPASVSGRLALLVDALLRCHRASARGLRAQPQLLRGDPPAQPDGQLVTDLRACALHLEELALEARRALPGALAAAGAGAVDLWPVLSFEPRAVDHVDVNDDALIVDMAAATRSSTTPAATCRGRRTSAGSGSCDTREDAPPTWPCAAPRGWPSPPGWGCCGTARDGTCTTGTCPDR